MHLQAYEYVQKAVAHRTFGYVVEFGSLNINGSVRDLFNCDKYHGIDLQAGPCVDEIADAAIWQATKDDEVDVIVCCEVLEHTPNGQDIIHNAYKNMLSHSLLIMTCATDPRAPHSAKDGGWLREGEYYENVNPDNFVNWCNGLFHIEDMQVIRKRGDLYVTARRI